jgi:hypothetical protein
MQPGGLRARFAVSVIGRRRAVGSDVALLRRDLIFVWLLAGRLLRCFGYRRARRSAGWSATGQIDRHSGALICNLWVPHLEFRDFHFHNPLV